MQKKKLEEKNCDWIIANDVSNKAIGFDSSFNEVSIYYREKNIDILNYVSKHNSLRPKLVIGFAAETGDVYKNAQKKLIEKNCDWIIANDVSNKSIGFDSNFNEVSIFYKDNKIKNEKLTVKRKSEISEEIIDRVIEQLN